MKADLIGIVDREALSPRSRHRSNDDIIPALIGSVGVFASPAAAMKDQTPEVVGIKSASYKPQALKRCQAVSIHIKANDRWQDPARALR